MRCRALLVRCGYALLLLIGAALAALGGLSLGGAGLVAVALAAVVAACVGAGIVRDGDTARPRQAAVDAAWRTGVGTAGVVLVLSGSTVLAGGALTAMLAGLGLGVVLVRWALRSGRGRSAGGTVVAITGVGSPVAALTVAELGREWLRTSAALAQLRSPAARQALVTRRQEALDELERRDPAGFARWLAGGATVDSDPARYVSDDPAQGYDAA